MHEKKAKILSLVPSWTETLVEAGVHVVGRTRFCIHPQQTVGSIPIVGGTKNIQIDEVLKLQPDLVILDREENKKEMAEALKDHEIEVHVSHVTSLSSAAQFLNELGHKIGNSMLLEYANRYSAIQNHVINPDAFWKEIFISGDKPANTEIEYVIWKNPFMVIGQGTFISEVLSLGGFHVSHSEKYPEIDADKLKIHFCLFSSEPFPFSKYIHQLKAEGFNGALIDGEKVSWYGIRNLRFLEACFE